jgi:hypothetical protein
MLGRLAAHAHRLRVRIETLLPASSRCSCSHRVMRRCGPVVQRALTPSEFDFTHSRQRRVGKPASVGGEPGGTSASIHGLGYLFSALRREGLIADELVLQLATFLGSLDLFLELTVRKRKRLAVQERDRST